MKHYLRFFNSRHNPQTIKLENPITTIPNAVASAHKTKSRIISAPFQTNPPMNKLDSQVVRAEKFAVVDSEAP
jgi:hypothetical protein